MEYAVRELGGGDGSRAAVIVSAQYIFYATDFI